LNANESTGQEELTTAEGKQLIDQIAEVSKPLLVLSGGEPLLRGDLFDLASHATERGLKVALGTNGTLLTQSIAERLASSGIKAAAISIDSTIPDLHDAFRGRAGAWERALQGVDACLQSGMNVQINTTVTQQNYDEIGHIMAMAEDRGATAFHLFFLVPTGRGVNIEDISADLYEDMLEGVLDTIATGESGMRIRPVCAPQFMRIASRRGLNLGQWSRGCIAGLAYCRIYPTGEVTPCPYLPVRVGSVRETHFKQIWFESPVLQTLRNPDLLKGKCGVCEYRSLCGGCRARAYGLSSAVNVCGGLHELQGLTAGLVAEEPWCPYVPGEVVRT